MDCIFCKIANKEMNSNFVYEDDKVFAIMDINPICDGHILVIPKEHYVTVFDVPEDILSHMFNIANQIGQKAMKVTGENGMSLAFNYGDKQMVKHVHLHIMPNYEKPASKTAEEVYKLLMED
ncbi:MAG: HIT family protein [Bacilli bacterium]|nr:HIT family protein [Bacilli bacterium]